MVWEGAAKIACGVAFNTTGRHGVAKYLPAILHRPMVVSSAPRLSIRRNMDNRSGAMISAMGRLPSQGKTFLSNLRRMRSP